MPKTLPPAHRAARQDDICPRTGRRWCERCREAHPFYYFIGPVCWDFYERSMPPADLPRVRIAPKPYHLLLADHPGQVKEIERSMPPAMRSVFRAVVVDGVPQKQVAIGRGVSASAICRQLDRASARFSRMGLPEPSRPGRAR
jgi:DNA-directed RNA polymerase specialized sigma24 family protein